MSKKRAKTINTEGDISSLGEFAAIDLIKRVAGQGPGRSGIVLGIGDDAAIIRPTAGRETLVTADMLVESVHFDLSTTGWHDLGYKSLAVNLSDIAAMGGRPRFYLVSVALRGDEPVSAVEDFYAGLTEAASPSGVRLIGGDTVGSPGPVAINITLIGDAPRGKAVRRSGAQPGDDIYVTGSLGDSAGGLEVARGQGAGARGQGPGVRGQLAVDAGLRHPGLPVCSGCFSDESRDYLIKRHLKPTARVKAGMLLGNSGLATAMLDISDGISSDLGHLALQSGLRAVIYEDRLPISDALRSYAGDRAVPLALHGGEDYELVFTAGAGHRAELTALSRVSGVPFSIIGELMTGSGVFINTAGGGQIPLMPEGYEHFRR